jgi:hypothetical protein
MAAETGNAGGRVSRDAPFAGITQIRFDGYDLSRSRQSAGTPCHTRNVISRAWWRNAHGTARSPTGPHLTPSTVRMIL